MNKPVRVSDLLAKKQKGEPIVMLTAYDHTAARFADAAGVDVLLVGDSVGTTVQGRADTLQVTLDEIVYHTRLVRAGAQRALVIADMPFMSYHVSVEQAVANAGRCVKEGGAQMVKVEGGERVADAIRGITRAQIPVAAHVGLTPQSINMTGGYKVQRSEDVVRADAEAVVAAGASLVVIECVLPEIARRISES